MVLQVAAAGAVFPVPIETHESEPARARLTGQRVARARGRCSAARTQQAERGAQLLIDRKLGGVETNELLKQLSSIAANASPGALADLQAVVAVAGATLVDRFDPETNLDARLWLRTLAIMNERGETPVVGG